MSGSNATEPIDPEDAVTSVIERLDAARTDAIPKGPLPPKNVEALEVARAEARAAAEDAGRGEDLDEAQRLMADWMFERYQHDGFESAFLLRGNDALQRRMDVIDLMVDAVTAAATADLISDETRAALLERFDALHGGESAG